MKKYLLIASTLLIVLSISFCSKFVTHTELISYYVDEYYGLETEDGEDFLEIVHVVFWMDEIISISSVAVDEIEKWHHVWVAASIEFVAPDTYEYEYYHIFPRLEYGRGVGRITFDEDHTQMTKSWEDKTSNLSGESTYFRIVEDAILQ